jgi:hypothetical protein
MYCNMAAAQANNRSGPLAAAAGEYVQILEDIKL